MESVEFVLGPSKKFILFLWLLYINTVIILIGLPIFLLLKIIVIIGSFLYCRHCCNFHAKRTLKKSVIRIWQDAQGRWGCQTKEGHLAIGKLKGDSFKSTWLLILRFRLPARSISVVVPADALSNFEYRILSARLHYTLCH